MQLSASEHLQLNPTIRKTKPLSVQELNLERCTARLGQEVNNKQTKIYKSLLHPPEPGRDAKADEFIPHLNLNFVIVIPL